ncbi:MAG: NAD-binding protein [Phycisphaeraceae bacterium]|nr:NAD-binding protein [Phycisphaeraceae bacterium]
MLHTRNLSEDTPDSLQRIGLSLALLIVLVVIGAVGLMLSGDRTFFEALYLTVVILTTVGMEGPVNDAERAWSLFLMIAGVGTVIYATGQVVSFLVEGQVRDVFGRHKMKQKINQLRDHTVVAGFGRMGRALCATLEVEARPFVLIENEPERVDQAEALGYLVILADAKQEQTLMEAGIDRAGALATCLPDDADNVFVTLSASGLHPDLHIVARAEDGATTVKLHRAGAARVVCPPQLSAVRVSDMLQHPKVDDMIELDGVWPDLEIAQLSAGRFPGLTGERISDLIDHLGSKTTVVAMSLASGERLLRPAVDTLIHEGDQLIIIGPRGWMDCVDPDARTAA